MSNIELANTTRAGVSLSQPKELTRRINEWIYIPDTFGEDAKATFVESINRFAVDTIKYIQNHVNIIGRARLKAIEEELHSDLDSLKLKPTSIAKSFGCGALGGLAAAQVATQVTTAMVMASCATPVGWIGGAGTAVIYYQFDMRDQIDKTKMKTSLKVEKTNVVKNFMLLLLAKRQHALESEMSNAVNSQLRNRVADLNTQVKNIGESFETAEGRVAHLENSLSSEGNRIGNLQESLNQFRTRNANLNSQLGAAGGRIAELENLQTELRQENQNLRGGLTTTALRVDELQRQNALSEQNFVHLRAQMAANMEHNQQMSRGLIAEMRADFEGREKSRALKQEAVERDAAVKKIVERGIEKALRQEQDELRQEQDERIFNLNIDLAKKSSAFDILKSEHDHTISQIKREFNTLTQTMSGNATERSVNELMKSNDLAISSSSSSEDYDDFVEVPKKV